MHAHSPQKMHMRSCMRTYATLQKLLCHETIANLSSVLREHRAGCRLPPALLPARRNQSPDAVRLRNPSKSTLAHNGSPLRCRTSINPSSALVQASSSLSMGHTRAWPWRLPVTEIHAHHCSCECSLVNAIFRCANTPIMSQQRTC